MNKRAEAIQREQKATALAQAAKAESDRITAAKEEAEKKIPKTYDDAKQWMIDHFEVPKQSITAFSVNDTPVTRASIQWKIFKRLPGPDNWEGPYYHDRTYDFLSQTVTHESDY